MATITVPTRLGFFVEGKPIPKQSVKLDTREESRDHTKRNQYRTYIPHEVQNWEATVRTFARSAINRLPWDELDQYPLKGPVKVIVTFCLPDRRRRDVENLLKSVNDALKTVVFEDDSQVDQTLISKLYKTPRVGVWIEVERLDPVDLPQYNWTWLDQ